MSKHNPTLEQLHNSLLTQIEALMSARLDILTLQTALVDKGVLSESDLAKATEKVTREGKKTLDDLEANPEKLKALLRGKPTDVQ